MVGRKLHLLAVDTQPKSVWLGARRERQSGGAALRVHLAAEFVERRQRFAAFAPDGLGRAMRTDEGVSQ